MSLAVILAMDVVEKQSFNRIENGGEVVDCSVTYPAMTLVDVQMYIHVCGSCFPPLSSLAPLYMSSSIHVQV